MSSSILVLEDDEAFRSMLLQALESQGHRVVGVGRAIDAIDRAKDQHFDLVVADIRMDGPSGLDALQAVQSQQPQVNSIVITGYSTEADSIRAVQLGVGDYLKKPFPLQTFLDSVEKILARKRAESRDQKQLQNLRRSLLWMLGSLIRDSENEALLRAHLERLEQLATRMALESGRREEIQLAFLWEQLEREGIHLPEFVRSLLPETVRQMLPTSALPDSLETQLIRAAQGIGEPGPRVEEALHRAGLGLTSEAPTSPHSLRSLLSLAGALAQGGNAREATEAYQAVLSLSSSGREPIEALFGLARLQLEPEGRRQFLSQAIELAGRLGPVNTAWIQLRASLMLSDPTWNQQALEAFRLTHNQAGHALAQLAWGRFEPQLKPTAFEALVLLMQPENASLILESSPWLLPVLLAHEGTHPSLDRALSALARNSHHDLLQAIHSSQLPLSARCRAVGLLGQLGASEILQELSRTAQPEIREAAARTLASSSGEASAIPLVRLFLLGTFEVWIGQEAIPDKAWKSQKVRYLLALLACNFRPLSEDHLLEAFWPEDLEKGRRNLYTATSYLRGNLNPGRKKLDYILRSPAGMQLNRQLPVWDDLSELEKGLQKSQLARQSGNPEAAVEALDKVVQLYRGPFLEGCYFEWAVQRRHQLEQRFQDSLLFLAEERIKQTRHFEAIELALRALELDPCCQEACRLLMRGYLETGRAEEAVRAFQQVRHWIARELEMEPSLELLELHQRALLSL